MKKLLEEIKSCTICKDFIEPRPVLTAHKKSRIVIIGQAPGSVVHRTGIPWNDKSGDNLRNWLEVEKDDFYNTDLFAIIPMGFCYPGKGKTGDLPPRKECAQHWHNQLMSKMPNVQLILLIGKYAQDYYLKENAHKNLTQTVKHFDEFLPNYFVLPHPSPRNNIWMKKNEWFKSDVLPSLKHEINKILK